MSRGDPTSQHIAGVTPRGILLAAALLLGLALAAVYLKMVRGLA